MSLQHLALIWLLSALGSFQVSAGLWRNAHGPQTDTGYLKRIKLASGTQQTGPDRQPALVTASSSSSHHQIADDERDDLSWTPIPGFKRFYCPSQPDGFIPIGHPRQTSRAHLAFPDIDPWRQLWNPAAGLARADHISPSTPTSPFLTLGFESQTFPPHSPSWSPATAHDRVADAVQPEPSLTLGYSHPATASYRQVCGFETHASYMSPTASPERPLEPSQINQFLNLQYSPQGLSLHHPPNHPNFQNYFPTRSSSAASEAEFGESHPFQISSFPYTSQKSPSYHQVPNLEPHLALRNSAAAPEVAVHTVQLDQFSTLLHQLQTASSHHQVTNFEPHHQKDYYKVTSQRKADTFQTKQNSTPRISREASPRFPASRNYLAYDLTLRMLERPWNRGIVGFEEQSEHVLSQLEDGHGPSGAEKELLPENTWKCSVPRDPNLLEEPSRGYYAWLSTMNQIPLRQRDEGKSLAFSRFLTGSTLAMAGKFEIYLNSLKLVGTNSQLIRVRVRNLFYRVRSMNFHIMEALWPNYNFPELLAQENLFFGFIDNKLKSCYLSPSLHSTRSSSLEMHDSVSTDLKELFENYIKVEDRLPFIKTKNKQTNKAINDVKASDLLGTQISITLLQEFYSFQNPDKFADLFPTTYKFFSFMKKLKSRYYFRSDDTWKLEIQNKLLGQKLFPWKDPFKLDEQKLDELVACLTYILPPRTGQRKRKEIYIDNSSDDLSQ
ncbi:hypothetical protein O181_053555 [Austropuccinia psidii MF-1]|uniref:Fork-head domain-containing protein n=1 Tax=Austropuccinia psidii MF-1 TaxID=1389203 RepID=A0A9Q3E0U7_9BASI|nr:hypothetical protein [Austropuccinia psidii MF-1]